MSAVGSARRFRLGLFVLAAAGLFVVLLAFVLEGTLSSQTATYYIMFDENVKGMVVGSKVNFQGVPVGVVTDMRFQDGKTLVEIGIDPTRASIQDVTKARMDRLLVTGQVTIELEGYEETGRPLPPWSVIEQKVDPMSSLKATIPEVVDQAARVLGRLDHALGVAEELLSPANRDHVGAILGNLEGASADLRGASAHLRERTLPAVDSVLADARRVAGEGSGLAEDARAALGRLEPALAGLAADAEALLRDASAFTNSVRAPTQTALASFRQALEDVRSLARQLKLAPDSLLFGIERRAAPLGGDR